jgi:hypothetical protein
MTFEFLCEHYDNASDYFIKGDITHTNEYGAVKIAELFTDSIVKKKVYPLIDYLNSGYTHVFVGFDREEMPSMDNLEGNVGFPLPYIDIDEIPQYEGIKKAMGNGLLDPCVLHLHPNEVMPRGQFLMVLFKALRISGKRPYLGEFCDVSRYEWDSAYVQGCIEENLIDATTVTGGRFRPNDALTIGEFSSFAVRGLQKSPIERDITIEFCFEKAKELGIIASNSSANEYICRADCYVGLVKVMELLDNFSTSLPNDVEVHPVG